MNPLRGLRILVVEDADDIRDVYARLFEIEGADVVAVSSGREALSKASERDFDVVVTDLGLPDIPGDEMIRLIRATAGRPLWIVAITGYGEPHIGRAWQAGADVVFTKPVGWSLLRDTVASRRAIVRAA
jgi:two-component system CheB/CheR fusion protein